MDESKNEKMYKMKKKIMDKKEKEFYREQKRAHMKATKKSQRMMGFRRAGESQESLGNRRVEPCHVHHHRDGLSKRWHADQRRERDENTGYGPHRQDVPLRTHRHADQCRRPTRSILHEKHHLEQLICALQRRLRKVNRQLNHRMEHRYGYGVADPRRKASRF